MTAWRLDGVDPTRASVAATHRADRTGVRHPLGSLWHDTMRPRPRLATAGYATAKLAR